MLIATTNNGSCFYAIGKDLILVVSLKVILVVALE